MLYGDWTVSLKHDTPLGPHDLYSSCAANTTTQYCSSSLETLITFLLPPHLHFSSRIVDYLTIKWQYMMQCMTVNPMCLSSALRHHREHAWLPSGSSSIAPSLLPAEDLQWLKSFASSRWPYRDNWRFRDFIQSFGLMPVEPAPDHKGNPRIWLWVSVGPHSQCWTFW